MSLEATEEAAENAQPAAVPADEPPPPVAAVPEQVKPADAEPGTVSDGGAEPAGGSELPEATGPAEPDRVPAASGEVPPASGEVPAASDGLSEAGRRSSADQFAEPDEHFEADGLAEPDERFEADGLAGPDERSGADELAGSDEPFGPDELSEGVEPAELAGLAEPGQPAHRRGLVLAALFGVATLAIVGGAIGVVAVLTHGFHKPATVTYRESAVFTLRTGDCVSAPNGQFVSVLPCSAPHQAEVFATFSLPASAWPGTAAVRAAATSGCSSRLTGYLNPQLAVSLAQSYVFPDQVAWTGGTRTVICEVRATSGQLTESVRAG